MLRTTASATSRRSGLWLLLALFLLHGCATKPTEWSAGTRSQAELDAAHPHCRAELKKEADAALRPQGVPALPPTAYRNAIDRAYFASIDQLSAVIAFKVASRLAFQRLHERAGLCACYRGQRCCDGAAGLGSTAKPGSPFERAARTIRSPRAPPRMQP